MYTDSYLKFGISFGRNRSSNQIIRRCIPDGIIKSVLFFYHELAWVDTLVPARLLKKCYKVGSIAPLCSKILMNSARRALNAKW